MLCRSTTANSSGLVMIRTQWRDRLIYLAMSAFVAWHTLATKIGVGVDDPGIGRPHAARKNFLDSALVVEVANTRGVMQQSSNGHTGAKAGERGQVFADRVI